MQPERDYQLNYVVLSVGVRQPCVLWPGQRLLKQALSPLLVPPQLVPKVVDLRGIVEIAQESVIGRS